MNASLLFPAPDRAVEAPLPSPAQKPAGSPVNSGWDEGTFAQQQIRALVRQIFHPGWPKPARHVVLAAVEDDTDLPGACLRVAEVLSGRVEGSVALVEAAMDMKDFRDVYSLNPDLRNSGPDGYWSLRNAACYTAENLWVIPPAPLRPAAAEPGIETLGKAIGRLRQDFDFSIVHAPPLAAGNAAVDLAQMSDGVVLALRAHVTRRAAARKAKEMMQTANVRVLGTVLSGRTFPIPDSIYRNL